MNTARAVLTSDLLRPRSVANPLVVADTLVPGIRFAGRLLALSGGKARVRCIGRRPPSEWFSDVFFNIFNPDAPFS